MLHTLTKRDLWLPCINTLLIQLIQASRDNLPFYDLLHFGGHCKILAEIHTVSKLGPSYLSQIIISKLSRTIAQINVGTFGQVQVATYISSHIYLDKCTTLWYAQDIQYRSSMCIPQIDAEQLLLEPSGEVKYSLYRP